MGFEGQAAAARSRPVRFPSSAKLQPDRRLAHPTAASSSLAIPSAEVGFPQGFGKPHLTNRGEACADEG